MKCPECQNEMKKGEVRAFSPRQTFVQWIPEEEKDKFFPKNIVSLNFFAEGWYCGECMKVFAVFEEK